MSVFPLKVIVYIAKHATALAAYQKGGLVAAEINAILAAEFCEDLLAPVVAAYADEKARILADGG